MTDAKIVLAGVVYDRVRPHERELGKIPYQRPDGLQLQHEGDGLATLTFVAKNLEALPHLALEVRNWMRSHPGMIQAEVDEQASEVARTDFDDGSEGCWIGGPFGVSTN